jgi:N-acetylneuraminic acid mutarotase
MDLSEGMDLFKVLYKTGAILMVLVMMIGCLAIVPNDASAASTDWVLDSEDTIERIAYASCELPDGRIFVSGGCNLTAAAITNETWLFDPSTSEWEQVADCPLVMESGSAVAMPDGKVYVFGGMVSMVLISDLLIYDVATDTWSTGTALPQKTLMWGAVAISDDVIMLAGGLDGAYLTNVTAKCFFYNTENSTFCAAPDLPDTRFWGGMTVSGSNVYYIGGSQSGGAGTSTIYAYSINGGYWSSAGTLPEAMTGMTATAGSDGLIYIIGGRSSFGWYAYGSESAYVYSTFFGTVTALPTLDAPVTYATSFETDDGRIFYMLGQNASYGNSVVYSLKVWDAEASLSSSTVEQGDSVWLHISISSNIMQMYGIGGTVYLCQNNVTYGSFYLDSTGENDMMVELAISEGMPAGQYDLVLSGVSIGYYGQDFPFDTLSLTVTDAPSTDEQLEDLSDQNEGLQDQLDDLSADLNATQDQLDNMTDQNEDLQDQLDDLSADLNATQDQLDAAHEDLSDSISAKQDAMFGYIILVLVIISLVIGVVILVRKK